MIDRGTWLVTRIDRDDAPAARYGIERGEMVARARDAYGRDLALFRRPAHPTLGASYAGAVREDGYWRMHSVTWPASEYDVLARFARDIDAGHERVRRQRDADAAWGHR